MRRGVLVLAVFALSSCAGTRDMSDGADALRAGNAAVAPGARRLQLVLSLTSPLFEQPVAAPWGTASRLHGVVCEWHVDPPGAAGVTLTNGRCTIYYRGYDLEGGALTADMGRQLGEAFVAALHRGAGDVSPTLRVRLHDAMDLGR